MYVYIYIYVYTCIYIYKYTHKHTHTHVQYIYIQTTSTSRRREPRPVPCCAVCIVVLSRHLHVSKRVIPWTNYRSCICLHGHRALVPYEWAQWGPKCEIDPKGAHWPRRELSARPFWEDRRLFLTRWHFSWPHSDGPPLFAAVNYVSILAGCIAWGFWFNPWARLKPAHWVRLWCIHSQNGLRMFLENNRTKINGQFMVELNGRVLDEFHEFYELSHKCRCWSWEVQWAGLCLKVCSDDTRKRMAICIFSSVCSRRNECIYSYNI